MQLAENETRRAVVLFAVAIWLPLALIVAKLSWDAAFYQGYDPALPLAAEVETTHAPVGSRRMTAQFQGTREMMIPSVIVTPAGEGPWPTVVFLHGMGQRKEFVDEIAAPFTDAGFAIVSFDQFGRGERSRPARGLARAMVLRRRCALTVIETRRLVDFLETQPYVDRTRLYLLGASYGAMTGAAATAMEPRLRAAVLVYGGGDLPALLDSPAAREAAGLLHAPARWLLASLLAPADPVRWVAGISPRPVLMFNGARDSLVPPASAEALHRAAREPKTVVWLETEHIGEDPAFVRIVIDQTLRFLAAQAAPGS